VKLYEKELKEASVKKKDELRENYGLIMQGSYASDQDIY